MDALRKNLAKLWATFFYSGLSPKAPGTMGSLAALPFAWFLWELSPLYAWLTITLCFILGVVAAEEIVRETGVQDNQKIVIDEVIGIFITTSVARHIWWHYALAFFFFRLFDIWKPGPVRLADRNVKGGFGVMLDDVVAALLATVCLWALLTFVLKA